MRRVSLAERPAVVMARAGRHASVAVAVVRHPAFGDCLVVSRRTRVNGHTGERMSHAGDVVLLGGAVEPGETAAEAAVREVCEEAGTPQLLLDGSCSIREHLGSWTTEAGVVADGFHVVLPPSFVAAAVGDPREVAELAYLPVAEVLAAEVNMEYHLVDRADRLDDDGDVAFESPTLRVLHPETREEWTLWGLAGFMVARWRECSERVP